MAITGHSTAAMHTHYSHADADAKATAVGKVIALVTRRNHDSDERERGTKGGTWSGRRPQRS